MPSSNELEQTLAIPIRTLQIIVSALALGPFVFLLVVVFALEPPKGQMAAGIGPVNLTTIALAFSVASIAVRLFVPATIVARARRELATRSEAPDGATRDVESVQPLSRTVALWNAYMVKTIVAAAMIEGACFFVIMAYHLERQPIALVLAAILLTAIACHFPTTTRVAHWLEDQLQKLDQERGLRQLANRG